MEINSVCFDEIKRNEYHFLWNVVNWDSFLTAYREGKKLVIRSPVFTARSLDNTSWFLTITWTDGDRFEFGLNRCEEDAGAEVVKIAWRIEITENGVQRNTQKNKMIYFFRRGKSYKLGFLTMAEKCFCIRTLQVTCKMNQIFIPGKPVLEITEALSIPGKLFIFDFENKKRIVGPRNTMFEFILHADKGAPLNIKVHRIDTNSTVSCYLMCFINIFQGMFKEKKLIWFGEIDHMHKMIKEGDIVEKAATEEEFPSGESKALFVAINYIFTVTSQNTTEKNSETTGGNATINNLKTTDENATGNTAKSHNDSITKLNSLVTDLDQMYNNKIYSDVTLQIGNATFKSHKCLLSARSPVFSAMLERDMLERHTGVVTITDMEVSTGKLLLQFVYTDRVDGLETESALKLLLAAEKYQILSLKEMCSAYLMNALSEDNVCEILDIADLVHHDGLKSSAMEYVKKYAHKVLNLESWKQLVKNNSSVVAETLSKISLDLWSTLNDKLVL